MPITPDSKDWTWAVERPCPECGFDPRDHVPATVGATIRQDAVAWVSILQRDDARVRPNDDRWSALEYACHVRDVYRVFDQRLLLMLNEENPSFENWDQDETAVRERYDLQDPARVSDELVVAGLTLAIKFEALRDDQWARPGLRSDGSTYTVASLGTLALHDPEHHRWDVALVD
jgi:hypothetical protein